MSEGIARARFGDHRACRVCDADIEFQGSRFGWVDRGGNRFCDTSGHRPVDADGVPGKHPHRLHRPNA